MAFSPPATRLKSSRGSLIPRRLHLSRASRSPDSCTGRSALPKLMSKSTSAEAWAPNLAPVAARLSELLEMEVPLYFPLLAASR